MIYHRFVCPNLNFGVIGALEDVLFDDDTPKPWTYDEDGTVDTLMKFLLPFQRDLQVPTEKGPCWFTESGYQKFHKAMEDICEELEARGYDTIHMTSKLSNSNILYHDEYQVVVEPIDIVMCT